MRARRFQKGSVAKRKRADGSIMLVFRWLDNNNTHRSEPLGLESQFPTPGALAQAVCKKQAEINDPDCCRFRQVVVGELFDMFMAQHVQIKCRKLTASVYRSLFDVHIRPVWGDHQLSQVKTVAVESWLESLPKSDQVKAHVKGLFHALFEYGVKYELVERNPVARIKQTRRRAKTPRILTPGEFQLLVAELREPVKTMVVTCAGLGLRVSELFGLKWGDINWENLEITIQRSLSEGEVSDTKTEASRAPLPLTADLGEVLLRHRGSSHYNAEGDFVFAGPTGKPPWPDGILVDHLKPAAVRAGIEGAIGWHTFRRSFATLLHSQGTGLAVQRELLRHADVRTTMNIYTQAVSDDKRAAIDKLGELLNKH